MPPPASPPDDAPDLAVQVAARLLAEGEAAEAAARLAGLVAAAPAYPVAHVLLARALEASGRDADALAAWHRAHFLIPNSPLVRRERQRLLDALVAAPVGGDAGPPEAPPAEPAPAEAEPEAPAAEDALTAALAGDLPDAQHALAEEPPVEAEEEGPRADAEAEPEETERPSEVAREAVAEPTVAPPDAEAPPAEPVAGEPEQEAAWWQRRSETEPAEADEEEGGWTLLEETEAPLDAPGVAEARITSPGAPDLQAERPAEDGVEDARVVEELGEPAAARPAADGEAEIEGPPTLADELDALISQLEDAPRIRPDPTFRGPEVSFDEEIADDMVSETLARIYVAQRQYAEAAVVYEKLAQQRPEQADEMRRRAAEMRAQAKG